MNNDHTRLLAEFRLLADSVLARIEPILAEYAERPQSCEGQAPSSEVPDFSGCSWCPVCALAAAIRGEHHELLAVLAGHAATLLALLRQLLDEFLGGSDGTPGGGQDGKGSTEDVSGDGPPRPSAFVPINVTVKR